MKPATPFTPIVQASNLYFVSGQIGIEHDSGSLVDSISAQTQQTMNNLAATLHQAGLGVEDIVKTTIYLKNIDDYKLVNEIYVDNMKGNAPARSVVAIAGLPKNALVKIEAIASKN